MVFRLVVFSVPLAPRRWRLQALLEAWGVAFSFAFFFCRLIAFARFAKSAPCVSGNFVLDVWTCAAAEESQNRTMKNPTNFSSGVGQFGTIGKKLQFKTARRQTRKNKTRIGTRYAPPRYCAHSSLHCWLLLLSPLASRRPFRRAASNVLVLPRGLFMTFGYDLPCNLSDKQSPKC